MSTNDRRRLARALADGISEEGLKDLLESLSITDDRYFESYQEVLNRDAPIWKDERPSAPGAYFLMNGRTAAGDMTFGALTIVSLEAGGLVDFLDLYDSVVIAEIEGRWAGPI